MNMHTPKTQFSKLRELVPAYEALVRLRIKNENYASAECRKVFYTTQVEDPIHREAALENVKKQGRELFVAIKKGVPHPYAPFVEAAVAPMIASINVLEQSIAGIEKEIVKEMKEHPLNSWINETKGVGSLTVARIINAAGGDLLTYDNPMKLWKRFGLAVREDGTRQQLKKMVDPLTGKPSKMTLEEARANFYSPQRRSIAYLLQDCVIRSKSPKYYDLYVERKKYETETSPQLTPKHLDNRARRWLNKRLLKDLWIASYEAAGLTVPSNAFVSKF